MREVRLTMVLLNLLVLRYNIKVQQFYRNELLKSVYRLLVIMKPMKQHITSSLLVTFQHCIVSFCVQLFKIFVNNLKVKIFLL